jgi:hypothetical protein
MVLNLAVKPKKKKKKKKTPGENNSIHSTKESIALTKRVMLSCRIHRRGHVFPWRLTSCSPLRFTISLITITAIDIIADTVALLRQSKAGGPRLH